MTQTTTPGPAPAAEPDPLQIALLQVSRMADLTARAHSGTTAEDRSRARLEAALSGHARIHQEAGRLAGEMALVSVASDLRRLADALPHLTRLLQNGGTFLIPYLERAADDLTRLTDRVDRDPFRVVGDTEEGPQKITARTFAIATKVADHLTCNGAVAVNVEELDADGQWRNVACQQNGQWHL